MTIVTGPGLGGGSAGAGGGAGAGAGGGGSCSGSGSGSAQDASLVSDELLVRIRGRAAGYDAANAFFADDLRELVDIGYLRMLVPTALGGLGFSLQRVAREQRRLASAAPATALAISMHLIWTGVAKVLHDRGDTSLDFVLREAAAGEIFAFGNSEAGNDLVLFGSVTRAEPQPDGSYRYFGRKIFTSLSPAWTRLGIFGLDDSDPGHPLLVHGFLRREDGGFSIIEDWDTLGMRATQSHTTVLDGAPVRVTQIARRLPAGPSADPLIFGIFANFEILIASVYTGIADRALELAVSSAHRRTSPKNEGRSYASDPDIRWKIAEAAIALDGIGPQLDALAGDVDSLVDHGAFWFPRLVGLKVRATETARYVVDQAVRVSGGSTMSASGELGRLYRDVLARMYNPSDGDSAHGTVANAWLGPAS